MAVAQARLILDFCGGDAPQGGISGGFRRSDARISPKCYWQKQRHAALFG
jgi:hypothetical protein